MNFNKVIIGGNVTRDPQLKHLPTGSSVTEFGVAVNRKWKTAQGEQREEVLFVDCAAFGKTGEVINEHFRKGKPIFIEGRLKFDQWEDKQGGGKRSKISVVVDSFQFVGGKNDGDESDQREQPRRQGFGQRPVSGSHVVADAFDGQQQFKEDEIPF